VFQLTGHVSFLILEIFIGLEELVESVVELDLLLFHRHENFERVFEFGKFFMLVLLLSNKDVYLFRESIDFASLVVFIDGNQDSVHAECVVGPWLWDSAHQFLDVSVGSQKDLHLSADCQVSVLTALLHEQVQEVLSFLSESSFSFSHSLFMGNWRNVETRVSHEQAGSELLKVTVATVTFNRTV
jgi:hypothetical protein